MINCRIGSLESPGTGRLLKGLINCRIGSYSLVGATDIWRTGWNGDDLLVSLLCWVVLMSVYCMYDCSMRIEYDPRKAASNLKKHKVSFEEAVESLHDPLARVIPDPDKLTAREAALYA